MPQGSSPYCTLHLLLWQSVCYLLLHSRPLADWKLTVKAPEPGVRAVGCKQTWLPPPALATFSRGPGKCGPLWASASPLHNMPEALRVKPQNPWTAIAWGHPEVEPRRTALSPCVALRMSVPFSHCDFSPVVWRRLCGSWTSGWAFSDLVVVTRLGPKGPP